MKIVVVEMNYHAEVISNLCPLLVAQGHEVSLLTTDKIFSQTDLSEASMTLRTQSASDKTRSFLIQSLTFINNHDLVLYTTLHDKFDIWSHMDIKAKQAVIVHNANAFFDQKNITLRMSLFFLWKDLSFALRILLFKRDGYYRNKVLNRIDKFIFPSDQMLDYVRNNHLIDSKRLVNTKLTWASFLYPGAKSQAGVINITIVGTIDRRKRNYSMILDCIYYLSEKGLSNKLKITLLGKPFGAFGKSILKKVKQLASDSIEVETFDGFVPMTKYHEVMLSTSFLIMPLIRETRHHIWNEEYGKTKISGNVIDMIRYAKPSVVPDFYELPKALKNCSASYHDQKSFNQLIWSWVEKRKFEQLDTEAIKSEYSEDNMQQHLKKVIAEI